MIVDMYVLESGVLIMTNRDIFENNLLNKHSYNTWGKVAANHWLAQADKNNNLSME